MMKMKSLQVFNYILNCNIGHFNVGEYIWYTIMILFTPACWLRNHSTDKKMDKYLNENILRDGVTVTPENRMIVHTVRFYYNHRIVELWIANYPFAFGNPTSSKELPSRKTAFKIASILTKNNIRYKYTKQEEQEYRRSLGLSIREITRGLGAG